MSFQVLKFRHVNSQVESKLFPIYDVPSGWYDSRQAAEDAVSENSNIGSTAENVSYAAKECRISDETYFDLTIPTVVADNNEVAHPSVLYIPEGFGGHQWWMAITPLPAALGGDYETYENPSIYCSDNGRTWVAPSGLINPIAKDPGGASDHNADTCLTLSPDRKTLYCLWVELSGGGTAEKVQMLSSTDGRTWGGLTTLLSVAPASERVLSPQLNWDDENSRWMLHTSDIVEANNTLKYCVRDDLLGEFGARTDCTYTLPDSETDVWHMDIRRTSTGRWFGILGTDASGGAHQQYPMDSTDGITWHFGVKLSERLSYKAGFTPISDSSAYLYWGMRGAPDWHVELVKLRFDRGVYGSNQAIFELNAAAGAAAKIGRYYTEDNFQRANESPCATADSGESWVMDAGTLDVVSNQLDANASGNNIGTIDVGFADVDITVEFDVVTSTFAYVVLRLSATNQFHRIGVSLPTIKFQRVGGAGTADIRSIAVDSNAVRKIRVVCIGTLYNLFIDDTFAFQVDDDDHVSNTKFGVQLSETATKVGRVIISRI